MKPKLRVGSLLLRALAVSVAAMCVAWGVAPAAGIASATVAAVAGVILGQLLARSRLRLPVSVAIALLLGIASFFIAGLVTGYESVPRAIGTGGAIRLAIVLRFGGAALAAVTMLRALAARRPSALVLELSAIAGAIAYVFAAHREGIISRPLWLSDWAWERGIDPVHVFLVLGGVAVVILGLLLVAEAEERRGSAAAVLAILAVLGVVLVIWIGPPKPEVDDRLNLTGPSDSASASASAAPGPPPSPPSSATPDAGDPDGGAQPQNQQPDGGQTDGGSDDGGQQQQPQQPPPDGGSDDGGSQQQPPQQPDGGGDDGGQSQSQQPDGGQSDGGGQQDAGDGGAPPPPPASEELNTDSEESNQSPSPMAVVLLESDYSPPSEVYYFRQEAWSQWNGTKLVRTTRADVDLDGLDIFPTSPGGPVLDVVDLAGREKVSAQVALLVDHTRPFALESPVSFRPLRNPNPARFIRAYSFEAHAQSIPYKELRGHNAGNPKWSPEVLAYYTQSTDDPRFAELAKSIVSRLPEKQRLDPFVQAVSVKLYLDDNYKYSRKETHSGTDNPTGDFLFGNKVGYCVHFAHAAVLLWRSLGLPARVGTGYAVEEKNRQGGSTILLRGSDAHAWPELYLEGAGWVVIDVTPHETLDETPPPVDDDLQRMLGEMARQLPPDPTDTRSEPPTDPRTWLEPIGLFALLTILAMFGLLYIAKLWRRAVLLWAGPDALPRVGYRASLDLLSEAGFARSAGESREAFAERLRPRLPSFEKLTAMHLAGQLGGSNEPTFGDDLGVRKRSAWKEQIRALRHELDGTPFWRRLLGFLNPLSFFRSR
ncbi:MAG: transglutaminase domain-containing protein [Polyangiaceae bacterium]